jgi:hypothetical protein
MGDIGICKSCGLPRFCNDTGKFGDFLLCEDCAVPRENCVKLKTHKHKAFGRCYFCRIADVIRERKDYLEGFDEEIIFAGTPSETLPLRRRIHQMVAARLHLGWMPGLQILDWLPDFPETKTN